MIDEAEALLRYLGPVVRGALVDDDVTEVYVNPQDHQVRVETRGGRTAFPCIIESEQVEMFLNAAAAREGVLLRAESPFLETTLPDEFFRRARLQGFVRPVTREPAFTIRKPPATVYGLDDYVRSGKLRRVHRERLAIAILGRESILVCGATNSGKTTFANALIHEIATIAPSERIVILEDTAELQCVAQDHLALRTPAGGSRSSSRQHCARARTESWSARCATQRRSICWTPGPRVIPAASRRCTQRRPPARSLGSTVWRSARGCRRRPR
jgi:type IV secretion system protein TrbB